MGAPVVRALVVDAVVSEGAGVFADVVEGALATVATGAFGVGAAAVAAESVDVVADGEGCAPTFDGGVAVVAEATVVGVGDAFAAAAFAAAAATFCSAFNSAFVGFFPFVLPFDGFASGVVDATATGGAETDGTGIAAIATASRDTRRITKKPEPSAPRRCQRPRAESP